MTSLKRQKEEILTRRFSVGDMSIRISVVRSRFECEAEDEELAVMNGKYVYGVELVNEKDGESASAPELTFERGAAESFAAICAAGLVTPTSFCDIVEDILAE